MDPSEIVYASWSPDEVVFDKGDGVGTQPCVDIMLYTDFDLFVL